MTSFLSNKIIGTLKPLVRGLGIAAILLVIGMIVIIFIGRQSISQLDQLRPGLKTLISSSTGMQVELSPISGQWPELVPVIEFQAVNLLDIDGESVFRLEQGRADLDILKSIQQQTTIWRDLSIKKLELSLEENAQGNWRLKGFVGQSDQDLAVILKPFMYSQLIRLDSIVFNLTSYSGRKIQLYGDQVLIENDVDFHRSQMSLRLEEEGLPAKFILEAYGDPAEGDDFYAKGYLNFEALNLTQSLKTFTQSYIPELANTLGHSEVKTGGEIWLDIQPGLELNFQGNIELSKIPLNWIAEDIPSVSKLKTQLRGWYQPGSDWGASFQSLNLNWGSKAITPIDMLFTQKLGSSEQEFDVSFKSIDFSLLNDLLSQGEIMPNALRERLLSMDPEGSLASLSLGRNQQGFYVAANLVDCNMNPYKGFPGLKNINGYLEIQQSKGLFHIADNDGFEIFFPRSYKDYLPINEAKGTIYFDWQSAQQLEVISDAISTKMEAGDSQVRFSIEQPRLGDDRTPELNLLIGARDLDLSLTEKYLPFTMPQQSSDWVKNSVKSGNLSQFGLQFRSGPPRKYRLSRTMQLLFKTELAVIKFNPLWPQLNQVDGLFLVDDGHFSGRIMSADLAQASLTNTSIRYENNQPADNKKWVIDGLLDADLSTMMNILAQSPVKKNLGAMKDWSFSGETQTLVHLKLPVKTKQLSERQTPQYKIVSKINNGAMKISGSPIALQNLSAEIEFSDIQGIVSDRLVANLWGQPLSARLFKDNNRQQLSFNTKVMPESLNKFVNIPWEELISGAIKINALLANKSSDPKEGFGLDISSNLEGVAINLPAPFAKPENSSKELKLRLHFNPRLSRLESKLGELWVSDILYQQGRFERGSISFNRDDISPKANQFILGANLPTIDIDQWRPVKELFSTDSKNPSSLQTEFDLNLDHWQIFGTRFENISASIRPLSKNTEIVFISDTAAGQVILPINSAEVPQVNLSKLMLHKNKENSGQAIDPRNITAVDFSVDQLSLAAKDLGSVSFQVRPEISGASFSNISGDIFGLKPGAFVAEAPTDFFWGYNGEEHLSKLVGPIGLDDIGHFFDAMGMPPVVDSKSGRLDADMMWQDVPWAVNKSNLEGELKLNLSEGSFYKDSGGAGTALKLVSLFNFANWLRRLRLDFSDVVGKNLTYNRLNGTLSFDRGTLSMRQPLKMKMPSGRMSIAGDFNMLDETADAQLVATLPVTTNLPWVAGVAGGLPAALGVYVTSKLVEKQVDRLSSISYELEGSWDDIKVSVDKIFAADLPE
jgi:uncharacterized protein (TIGR02099 family)